MSYQQNLTFFQELVSCNYSIYFWEYDPEGNLLNTTCPDSVLLDNLFSLSRCKDFLLSCTSDRPLLLSDSIGLMWSAVFAKEKENIFRIHVMGPVFINQNSKSHLEQQLALYDLSVANKRQLLQQFENLPLITSPALFQYTIMFHYSVRGEKLTIGDLNRQKNTRKVEQKYGKKTESEPTQDTSGLEDKHAAHKKLQSREHLGIRNLETELLSMVTEGNLNYQSILNKAGIATVGNYSDIGDPIQQARYSVHSFMTLCSRAAIAGGLSAPTAYDLCDMYGEAIYNCKTLTEIMLLNHTMYEDFINRVHQCRQNPDISNPVQICCDYISMHLTEDLDIESLAEKVGYTAYYLSRKFKKEVGTSINNYIRERRIEHAKHLLTTTRQSIQEISTSLHFCSRSYFADNFQKLVGMSPSDYREQNQNL